MLMIGVIGKNVGCDMILLIGEIRKSVAMLGWY
jgi:hypothetical protein